MPAASNLGIAVFMALLVHPATFVTGPRDSALITDAIATGLMTRP